MRVQHRREGERHAWLPEVFCENLCGVCRESCSSFPSRTVAAYRYCRRENKARPGCGDDGIEHALLARPSAPGAEEPPQSLRKLDRPETEGTLWAPDTKKWPHPEFYWQRFRHEGVPALERRGWEVRFTADVGFKPLVFRTDTWQAEIVDEGKGWFHLSAGFEIDGETFELQPILAALVKNRFLDVTEGMPSGQEFMIFLPDGRGLALPVGRFRRILKTLGELLEFKFGNGPVKLGKLDAALVAGELAGESLSLTVPQEVEELSARLRDFESIERVPLPTGLRAELREYQYRWLLLDAVSRETRS